MTSCGVQLHFKRLNEIKPPQTQGANTELVQAHPPNSNVMLFPFEGMTLCQWALFQSRHGLMSFSSYSGRGIDYLFQVART